ncbi:prepilin-type N-terminal cleavage/methylation domain-containing protein [Patescibacteria group bacterium]|nr:prepilin-type N-terminal cleavage/methylation domain-containing protein [Patescibacteria group bacterium]
MNKKRGYTLIELVVVIGVLMVLVTFGIVSLVSFKERREVLGDARSLAVLLRQVQIKSSAVEIPSGCSSVAEFEIVFSGSEVNLLARDPSGGICKPSTVVLSFITGTKFVIGGSVVFKVPSGSTESTIISVFNHDIQYDLEVSKAGSVSEPQKAP